MALSAPTGLAVTETLGKCALSWNTVATATFYRISRKPSGDPDSSYKVAGITTALTFDELGVPTTNQDTQAALVWVYGVTANTADPADESSKATVTATMPTITQTDIDNAGIIHPKYEIGAGWVTASESDITKGTSDTTDATGGEDSWLQSAIQREWD